MILVGGIQLKKQQKKKAAKNLHYVLSNITDWAWNPQDGCEANFCWYFVFFLWLQLAFKKVAQINKLVIKSLYLGAMLWSPHQFLRRYLADGWENYRLGLGVLFWSVITSIIFYKAHLERKNKEAVSWFIAKFL